MTCANIKFEDGRGTAVDFPGTYFGDKLDYLFLGHQKFINHPGIYFEDGCLNRFENHKINPLEPPHNKNRGDGIRTHDPSVPNAVR